MERPNAIFGNEKYNVLNNFFYKKIYKSSKICDHQLSEIDNNLIENDYKEYSCPSKIKLMISGERMQPCKITRIIRHYLPNKLLAPEKFAYHVLLLFYSFRDEKN